MTFYITANSTTESVTLQRETVPAALKKAGDLLSGGYADVEIVMPDGAIYVPSEFDQLRERVGIAIDA